MINETETLKKFGYESRALRPKSNKKIIVICPDCNKNREIVFATYKNPGRCQPCALKYFWRNTHKAIMEMSNDS